jgi:hypothetical protein
MQPSRFDVWVAAHPVRGRLAQAGFFAAVMFVGLVIAVHRVDALLSLLEWSVYGALIFVFVALPIIDWMDRLSDRWRSNRRRDRPTRGES